MTSPEFKLEELSELLDIVVEALIRELLEEQQQVRAAA